MAENPLGVPDAWLGPVTLRARSSGEAYARTRVTVRGHTVMLDEPPERDGTDTGPAPTEMLLVCLAGVSTVILNRLARRDGRAITSLEADVEATLDRRGVWLSEAVPLPWSALGVTLRIVSDASDDELRRWAADLDAFSPIHALFRSAGAPVGITLTRG